MNSSQDEADRRERGEEPAEPGKRAIAGWLRRTPEEKAVLGRLSAISGVVSAVTTYIQLGHNVIVVLALAIGISIVVPVATIAIYRSVIHRVEIPIALVLAGGIIAALLGTGSGVVIRSITTSSHAAQNHPVVPSSPKAAISLASGNILVPRDGAVITGGVNLRASGTERNLPSGYRLDLFLKVPSVPSYYAAGDPRNVLRVGEGTWSGAIFIGTLGQCTVYLVELSPKSVALMNSEIPDRSGGYPSIAALGTILASVSVTAK